MALANVGSGTQTCTIDTIHTLDTETSLGVYQGYVNLTELANGDVIRVFVTTKVLTGDTEETLFEATYANDLGANCIVCTPPWVSEFSTSLKIEQTDGTGRSVGWAVYQLG